MTCVYIIKWKKKLDKYDKNLRCIFALGRKFLARWSDEETYCITRRRRWKVEVNVELNEHPNIQFGEHQVKQLKEEECEDVPQVEEEVGWFLGGP